jgi:hypothetical protein
MRCPSIDGGSRPQPTPPAVEGDGPQPPPAACRAPESGVGCQRPRHDHARSPVVLVDELFMTRRVALGGKNGATSG